MIDAITKTFVISHGSDPDARLAKALVFNAGRLAWRMRESGLHVEQKTSVSDVVTEADRVAERFIAQALRQLRPDDAVFGEEGARSASRSGRTWVIDPVDGTYNFAHGSDYYCSALALVTGDVDDPEQVHFGAIHRPAMGYTWFGGADHAPTRDSAPLTELSCSGLEQSSLATYMHPTYLRDDRDAAVRQAWLRVASQAATLRMLGAGSVDLAGVAEGGLGAWMQHSVPAWDWLPGKALVEAAGGAAVQHSAGGVTWSIAGNRQVVQQIVGLLGAPD